MNTGKLNALLTIKPSGKNSIFEVIGRMEVLLEYFKKRKKLKNLIPFLETYYLVTKSVAERSLEKKKYFNDYKKLEMLDVYFASLYFLPLRRYLINGVRARPWQNYFLYCERKDGIPFLQMLLGINAHINTDLLQSVLYLNYQEGKDFRIINPILKEEIPEVMKFLAFHDHDVFGAGALIFKKFVEEEFHNIVVAWRNAVWNNANMEGRAGLKVSVARRQTEEIAKSLISIFHADIFELHWLKALHSLDSLSINGK